MNKEINIDEGGFFLHEGKMLRFNGTKWFSDRTEYSFGDWRLGGGVVLQSFHSEEDEKVAFAKVADWMQEAMIQHKKRLDKTEEILKIASNPITCPAIIKGWKEAKRRQDEGIAEFYERNPQIND